MKFSNKQFALRRMQSEDIAEVHALEEQVFPTPWSQNSYQFEVERNAASKPWILETEDEQGKKVIAGYIVPWLLVDELHVANIAVAPQFRRLGLARKLLRHSLVEAAQDGAISASLEVRASNTAAQALYKELGFIEVGRRKHYYHNNGEDALLMLLPRLDDQIVRHHLEAH
jgi:ribosomal-protein-alanine N-acetyltransferase